MFFLVPHLLGDDKIDDHEIIGKELGYYESW
jgi:hypothetical protein